ncbi:MAG: PTS sugar transporter subunit IIA [Elusimicrobia bacterium]|nr:PTS sugar transporter subunit IIA [Elusimicrobiota bacterium]
MPAKEGKPSRDMPATKTTPPAKTGAARSKSVRVSSLLSEDVISIVSPPPEKGALIESMVKLLCGKKGLGDPAPFLAKVFEREKKISTTLDTGLSLPHNPRTERAPGAPAGLDPPSLLTNIFAALTVIPDGMTDPMEKDIPISVMFLFLSPDRGEFFPMHLQFLRSVASLFQPSLIGALAKAPTPAAVLELIRKAEK